MVLLSCINTSFSYFVHPSYISERRLKSIKFKKKKILFQHKAANHILQMITFIDFLTQEHVDLLLPSVNTRCPHESLIKLKQLKLLAFHSAAL